MNTITKKYLKGLKQAYFKNNVQQDWEHFEKVIHGAKREDLDKLKQIYPEIPTTLIDLLTYVDGTYWRKYDEEKIAFYILGSDMEEYPYYLLSSKQMIKNQNQAIDYYADYIDRAHDVPIDIKIANNSKTMKWLHFSDCSNNGGTSQLFIDFSPSAKGKKGQIVRFLHDPDEFEVIADSFEAYLKKLMDNEYNFINEETI